jgi:hypothetical protein
VSVDNSVISWYEANTDETVDTSVNVATSIDNGATFANCTNGAAIPNLPPGTSTSNLTLQIQVILASASPTLAPFINQIQWRVLGHYSGASGTRSTIPNGFDTSITRTVSSGWGTASDGQTWIQNGAGVTAVYNNFAVIGQTTGDVAMVLGSRAMSDSEITCRLTIGTLLQKSGVILRAVDANNYYFCVMTGTGITIYKKAAGIVYPLEIMPMQIIPGFNYRLRFRIVGHSPVRFYCKLWLDGTLEPGLTNGIVSLSNPQWTLLAADN